MTFICTIDPKRTHIDGFREENDWFVHARVGYDSHYDLNYSLVVGLSPAPGWDMEFYFRILIVDGDAGTEEELNDGLRVAQIMSRDDRKKVRDLLYTVTAQLISSAQPDKFFMSTREPCLPHVALEKYSALCCLFVACGYAVHECDEFHGHRLWCAELASRSDVEFGPGLR